jgi:hypothetical protein
MSNSFEMYAVDDETEQTAVDTTGIQFKKKGMIHEVVIHGKTVELVDPRAVVSLLGTIKLLQEGQRKQESLIQQLSRRIHLLESQNGQLIRELENKVSYES